MEKTTKRRFGDRKDGVLLRDLDGMHFITPIIYPNRCDNEAYVSLHDRGYEIPVLRAVNDLYQFGLTLGTEKLTISESEFVVDLRDNPPQDAGPTGRARSRPIPSRRGEAGEPPSTGHRPPDRRR